MSKLQPALYLILFLSVAACSDAGPDSQGNGNRDQIVNHDGRQGAPCTWFVDSRGTASHKNASDVNVDVCRVSMFKLIADPMAFHGRYVDVRGLLVAEQGRLAIYPSIELAKIRDLTTSIEVDSTNPDRLKSIRNELPRYVAITAKFDAKVNTWHQIRLGFFSDVQVLTDWGYWRIDEENWPGELIQKHSEEIRESSVD